GSFDGDPSLFSYPLPGAEPEAEADSAADENTDVADTEDTGEPAPADDAEPEAIATGQTSDAAAELPGLDSLGHTMTTVVINPFFDWAMDRQPRRPYNETVIYEAHVKGMTATHPDVPEHMRGTYAGLAHPAI